jgi:hypothetical protein
LHLGACEWDLEQIVEWWVGVVVAQELEQTAEREATGHPRVRLVEVQRCRAKAPDARD